MMIRIPGVLNAQQVMQYRTALNQGSWVDGNVTSGEQSARAKQNRQLPEGSPLARQLGETIQDALASNALFFSAALPLKVFPPLFNRYSVGDNFGAHIDNAIRHLKGTNFRLRTDLSATLFLEDPAAYEGGELVVEDNFGDHSVKLAAGDMVLYPASSLHRVMPVTKGVRLAAFFWIQSMVRDEQAREMLFNLDQAIQEITPVCATSPDSVTRLTGVYHNLLRRWSDV